jgi:hypothetical protein
MLTRRLFLAAPAVAAAQTGGPRVLERYVAIDNVCAWPKVVALADGSLAAAIYNQPVHGQRPGDVECWVSADGRFWRKAGTAAPHEPGTGRLNHAIGVARNGDLIAMAGGWVLNEEAKDGMRVKRKLLPPWVSRSADGGRTWTVDKRFPDGPDGYAFVPFGNIVAGRDGALRASAYVYRADRTPRVDTCCVLRSPDDGRTWRVSGTIGDRVHNECDIAHLGGGRWLAVARKIAGGCDVLVSEDDAATWKQSGFSTQTAEHPGDLCVLKDGVVMLTYGSRRPEWLGVAARISRDGGRTWSDAVRLAETTVTDAGYPSSAGLQDGSVVTVYYAKSAAGHSRYHMGSVIWQVE